MLAYLVIREGSKWTDVFRLVPGETVRLGRAPTNQIVLKDDRCSRWHAEVFYSQGSWVLRDLRSRNGTHVGTRLIEDDYVLQPGDIVRIGRSQLAFVHDLSTAFPDPSGLTKVPRPPADAPSAIDETSDGENIFSDEPATITHRRGHTKFLDPAEPEDAEAPDIGRAATRLCRLAFELAKSADL